MPSLYIHSLEAQRVYYRRLFRTVSKTADRFHKRCLRGFYLNILINGFIHKLLNMKVKVDVSTAGTYNE